jgi:hypothetical protein
MGASVLPAGTQIGCHISKNGTVQCIGGTNTEGSIQTGVSDIVFMNGTTDYLEFFARNTDLANIDTLATSDQTYLTFFKL